MRGSETDHVTTALCSVKIAWFLDQRKDGPGPSPNHEKAIESGQADTGTNRPRDITDTVAKELIIGDVQGFSSRFWKRFYVGVFQPVISNVSIRAK